MTFEQLNTLPVWQRMPTLSLDEIAAVKLMNRVDTKYVLDEAQCLSLLEAAAEEYSVQVVEGCRACRYSTLYYDTPQWDMYLLHHNRRLTRQKIRTRTYVETGVTFLEIKDKNNKGRTRKRRIAIDRGHFAAPQASPAAAAFLQQRSRFAPATLTPSLATRFVRITLVNSTMTERLTIDFDLMFDNMRDSTRSARMRNMVIVELKQDAHSASPMKRILGQMRIKPLNVSKYCLGEALTNPMVKHNRFKAKIRRIAKITDNKNTTL